MAIGTTAPRYAHGDGLGSLRLVTDATGAAVSSSTYEPWGAARAGSQTLGGFGFAGEQTDSETGFVYLRARHHDPQTGRFLTEDTYAGELDSPSSQHRFGYAQSNPVAYSDPSGHWPTIPFPFKPSPPKPAPKPKTKPQTRPYERRPLIPPLTELCDDKCAKIGYYAAARRGGSKFLDDAWFYQMQITGVSPELGFYVHGTNFADGTEFDGCRNGVLLDAKGESYAKFFEDNGDPREFYEMSGGFQELLNQAERQVRAAKGAPIVWHVAEKKAADAIRRQFAANNINITVIYTPYHGKPWGW